MACRRASWPTRRSPWSVNATTEGVVRDPSALEITDGWPPSTAAITEFVVPRSIPTAFAISSPQFQLPASAGRDDRGGGDGQRDPHLGACRRRADRTGDRLALEVATAHHAPVTLRLPASRLGPPPARPGATYVWATSLPRSHSSNATAVPRTAAARPGDMRGGPQLFQQVPLGKRPARGHLSGTRAL